MRQGSVRLTRPYRLQNSQLDHTRRSAEELSHGSPRSQGTARVQMGLGTHRRPPAVPPDRRSSSRLPQLAQEPALRSGLPWTPHRAKLRLPTPLHDSSFQTSLPQQLQGLGYEALFFCGAHECFEKDVLDFGPPPAPASAIATHKRCCGATIALPQGQMLSGGSGLLIRQNARGPLPTPRSA
jgi:hypothetical protein